MHNWFKCTVSYETDAENGMKKKVKEEYLVDALSYTCLLYTSDAADE